MRNLKKVTLLTFLGFFLIGIIPLIEMMISESSIVIKTELLIFVKYGFVASSIIVFVAALYYTIKRSTYHESKINFDQYEIDEAWAKDRKEREREKIARTAEKDKENFAQINFNLESELEAVLEIKYSKLAQTKTRLFFGKEGRETIYSRDYLESSKSNFVHLKILPSRKQHSTQWVKKGTHDVGDNFESGYTLEVILRDAELSVRKFIIEIIRKKGFGCLPTARTIHCHLDAEHPTEYNAKGILKNILYDISQNTNRISLF